MNICHEENNIKQRLQLRAQILAKIRSFFARRSVLEVETPLLYPAVNPAPFLNSFNFKNLYLQTSPEFAMKRLLAAGSGDIYQISKAFRQEELGRMHHYEFTLLEWYRVNFDHYQLMDEVDELLSYLLHTPKSQRYTYKQIYQKFLKIDPHRATLKQLQQVAEKNNLFIASLGNNIDSWLQLLFTYLIEPSLGCKEPVFIYDFPEAQAMLSKIRGKKNRVASRFEVYCRGMELANGFHELTDPQEQRRRFNEDLVQRKKLNLPAVPLDEKFLAALAKLPNCAGIALGIDRLLLVASGAKSLDEVLCFRE